jgi:hypothetical protein
VIERDRQDGRIEDQHQKVEDSGNPTAKSARVAVSTEEESTVTTVVDLETKAAEEKKKVEFVGGKDANHETVVFKAVDDKDISEDIDPANEVRGTKLIRIHLSICQCTFLVGLDFNLIATAVPLSPVSSNRPAISANMAPP